MRRKILEIDEQRCYGCGLCTLKCAENAIVIENGKAKIISDILCDGLGACLPACPAGALRLVEREAEAFDLAAVHAKRDGARFNATSLGHSLGGASLLASKTDVPDGSACACAGRAARITRTEETVINWPIKLRLTQPAALAGCEAKLVLAADCAPAVMPDFNAQYGKGNVVLTCCPKFEDPKELGAKLAEVLKAAKITDYSMLRMEVPCCGGMRTVLQEAFARLKDAGVQPQGESLLVGRSGEILEKES